MPTGQLFVTAEQEVTPSPTVQRPGSLGASGLVFFGGPRQPLDTTPVAAAAAQPPIIQPFIIRAAQARQGRRAQIFQNRWPGYQFTGLAPVTPLPKQFVQDPAPLVESRRHPARIARILQNRWPGYQFQGLAPVPPLPRQVVISAAESTAANQQNRARKAHIILPRRESTEVVVTPPPPRLVRAASSRLARVTRIITNRWPGYQWVGLPPILPLPRQVVVEPVGEPHRRGRVTMPPVQLAAASSAPPPVTPPPPRLVRALPPRIARAAARIITNRWPGYQWVGLPAIFPLPKQVVVKPTSEPHRAGKITTPAVQRFAANAAAPTVTPLPRQIIVSRPASPTQPRRPHTITPRTMPPPATPLPPRQFMQHCPQNANRYRNSEIITTRPAARQPGIMPPRPNIIKTTPRTPQRGRSRILCIPSWLLAGGISPPFFPATTGPYTDSPQPGVGDSMASGAYADSPFGGVGSGPATMIITDTLLPSDTLEPSDTLTLP